MWPYKTISDMTIMILTEFCSLQNSSASQFAGDYLQGKWTDLYRFRSFRKIEKSDYFLRCICPSVCPHGTHRLPLDEFSWYLSFGYFSKKKKGRENSSFFQNGEEWILYLKTARHFWPYLAQFFLEWENFQTNIVEKIKTHISRFSPRKSCSL